MRFIRFSRLLGFDKAWVLITPMISLLITCLEDFGACKCRYNWRFPNCRGT